MYGLGNRLAAFYRNVGRYCFLLLSTTFHSYAFLGISIHDTKLSRRPNIRSIYRPCRGSSNPDATILLKGHSIGILPPPLSLPLPPGFGSIHRSCRRIAYRHLSALPYQPFRTGLSNDVGSCYSGESHISLSSRS
jgi:hypothetical protein